MRAIVLIPICLVILSGCDPDTPSEIDASYASPVLTDLRLSTTTVDTDTILVGPVRLADDELPIRLIASVRLISALSPVTYTAYLQDSQGDAIPVSVLFNDDGTYPDTVADDGTFTSIASFEVLRTATGNFSLGVSGRSSRGLTSNTLWIPFILVRANQPPVLSDLEADTLVSLSSGNTSLQLRITASDPNGPEDVQRVWFDSFRPDGTPSSGNPFLMFDDGNTGGISGDQLAQDGIYGLIIAFQGASPGTYRFSFKASDRSRDTSNVIDHLITVIP